MQSRLGPIQIANENVMNTEDLGNFVNSKMFKQIDGKNSVFNFERISAEEITTRKVCPG